MNGLLLVGVVSAFSQEPRQMYDINNIINKNDFEKIVQFILNNGDRLTYCQMYNNNPHYSLEDFHIYLNPISQWINTGEDYLSYSVSDYDNITIQDWNSPHRYYKITLLNEKVYIWNPDEFEQKSYEGELLKKYIPKLKSLIGERK
jgi:hypothetical protein